MGQYKQLPTSELKVGMTIIYGQGWCKIVELLPCEGHDPLARLSRDGVGKPDLQVLPTHERSFAYPYGQGTTLRMWTVEE